MTAEFAIDTVREWLLAGGVALLCLFLIQRAGRWLLALRGFALVPALSRALARIVRSRELSFESFLAADGAAMRFQTARRQALERLSSRLENQSPVSAAWGRGIREDVSDLRFADANRVPFHFAKVMRERFNVASVAVASRGRYLVDLDGHEHLDVSGSYGVNVAGYERLKAWTERGLALTRELGCVLGPLHPLVADNVARLKSISGLDEVSFHVSGTEAVMAAARLARFNTRRKLIVTFSGAYHGWWDGVQPGIGSERALTDCLTLKEMNTASLDAIRLRARDIAGVFINPVQSFHPNSPPPNDAVLMSSDVRKVVPGAEQYREWLRALRATCTEFGIPLVFDEVYSGFRLAPGGAQAWFGVTADMVVYGKTLGGGQPVGVVCGRRALMQRFDPERPMRLAYVVGTFAAHPLTMGSMNAFLEWVSQPDTAAIYARMNERCDAWSAQTNTLLEARSLPLRVVNMGTIWTIEFTEPSRFNWLLQYYLRGERINLSWVGTGRCLFSLDFSDADFQWLTLAIVHAAEAMRADKWWLTEAEHPRRAQAVRKHLRNDLIGAAMPLSPSTSAFISEVMRRKHDDHVASHSDRTNQLLHLLSSSLFVVCYALIFADVVTAMWLGLGALFIRQIGHALIEPPCHDKEQLLLGFDTRSKTAIVAVYLLIPLLNLFAASDLGAAALWAVAAQVAIQWLWFTAMVVFGRVLLLFRKHGLRNAMVWFIKLVTDPFTDIVAYWQAAMPQRRG
jgi:glutamate-1-semialdehyde 2,1-aminomutase